MARVGSCRVMSPLWLISTKISSFIHPLVSGSFKDLEFKTDKGTNSGVIIYCTDTKNRIPKSVKIQIADPFADKWAKSTPTWHGGGIFGHLAPAKQVTKKPGEWNHMTIEAKGKQLKVWLNGELTADMTWRNGHLPRKTPMAPIFRNGSALPSPNCRPKAASGCKANMAMPPSGCEM